MFCYQFIFRTGCICIQSKFHPCKHYSWHCIFFLDQCASPWCCRFIILNFDFVILCTIGISFQIHIIIVCNHLFRRSFSIFRIDISITVRCLELYQLQIITGKHIQVFKYRISILSWCCLTDTDITAIQIQFKDRTCKWGTRALINLFDTDLMLCNRTCGRGTEGYVFDRITRIWHILSGSRKVYRIGDRLSAQFCCQTVKPGTEFKDILIGTNIRQLNRDLSVHNSNNRRNFRLHYLCVISALYFCNFI